mmetsp:Transcript_101681/g.276400  ORF Transcript_101681/g.276400 Transcript_101681/m.276400 type:complete len:290 (-) Transcript_101681:38-907(-)
MTACNVVPRMVAARRIRQIITLQFTKSRMQVAMPSRATWSTNDQNVGSAWRHSLDMSRWIITNPIQNEEPTTKRTKAAREELRAVAVACHSVKQYNQSHAESGLQGGATPRARRKYHPSTRHHSWMTSAVVPRRAMQRTGSQMPRAASRRASAGAGSRRRPTSRRALLSSEPERSTAHERQHAAEHRSLRRHDHLRAPRRPRAAPPGAGRPSSSAPGAARAADAPSSPAPSPLGRGATSAACRDPSANSGAARCSGDCQTTSSISGFPAQLGADQYDLGVRTLLGETSQ